MFFMHVLKTSNTWKNYILPDIVVETDSVVGLSVVSIVVVEATDVSADIGMNA